MHKKIVLLAFVSALLLLTTFGTLIMIPVSASTLHVYPGDSIQAAINSAQPRDTIIVHNGTYYEHVIVDKAITLIGENKSTTIIDGEGTGIIIRSYVSNVEIRGFTIQNGGDLRSGVYIGRCSNNTISDSIIRNNDYGIKLIESNGCSIINNTVMNCSWAGIQITDSSNNNIHENTIANNYWGVDITSNSSLFNTFYHNNFIDNPTQARNLGSGTVWDNGNEGNYWSDYTGEDLNSDGIGDTNIPHLGLDRYPLMKPFQEMTPPVADAGPDQLVFQGMTVTFNGSGSRDDIGIKSYVWTFTDVTPKTLTGVSPTYRFKNVGNFSVTLNVTDYSSKWDIDTMWVNVSADTTKPFIGVPSQEPEIPGGGEKVTIRVNVTDEESGVRNVTISYGTNSGPWNNVSMSKLTGNNTWTGLIPEQTAGTNVTYWIIAYDNSGNPAVDDNGKQYYVYTVVPEFPATIFLLMFLILTLVAVTLRKRKKRTFKL